MASLLSTDGGLASCLGLSGSRKVLLSEGSPRHEEAGPKPPEGLSMKI